MTPSILNPMQAVVVFLLTLLLVLPRPAFAVKHINPQAYPNAAKDKVHAPSTAEVRRFGSLRAAVASSAIGTKTVAVILVQFPSASGALTSGSRSIQSVANIKNYFDQMSAYFYEASYGKLTVNVRYMNSNTATANGDLTPSAGQTGVYTLANSMEYYGCGDEGVGCSGVTTPTSPGVSANGDFLIRDALIAARAGHANLNSTTFDAVIVMHAGNGNETTLASGDIWSIFYSQDPVITAGGGGFDEGDVVPETEASGITSPLGVIVHEFGHELGLPDLYNTTSVGGTSVVGNWDIMDSGPFVGSGANPSHPGAWDKYHLGWAVPSVISSRGSASIGFTATGTGTNMLKIPVQNGLAQEYFLVEYRSTTSGATYDRFVPGDGLLIWHVDDDITSTRGVDISNPSLSNTVNSGSPHYGVSIVTADGVGIGYSNQGQASNTFSSGSNFTSPKSDNFSGQPSGISLVNIAGVGDASASFDVANFAVTSTQSISKVVAYPNPAGKGYPSTRSGSGGWTTLRMQLTRPPNECTINIYTVSGELVRKIGRSEILPKVTGDRSGDYKWVYEYDWDLTNGDNQMVAPGVYLWIARADGEHKTGKVVVIR